MTELQELLDHYFSLGVAEGKEGRNHDTKDGEAQATRDLIDQKIMRLRRESAEARKAAFIEAAEIAYAYECSLADYDGSVDAKHFYEGGVGDASIGISKALRAKAEETRI